MTIPQAALDLVGTINNAAISPVLEGIRDLVFPIHTLLFQPPTLGLATQPSGVTAHDVTYRFLYRPETWRAFYRASTEAYESIYHRNADGTKGDIYEEPAEADLSVILP